MNKKLMVYSMFATVAGLSLVMSGTLLAQPPLPLEKVSFSATLYGQNTTNDTGKTTTVKAPIKQIKTTANLIEQLTHDEFAEGNLASDSLPAGAALYFNGSGFEIAKGTNEIVDVSDILTWNVTGTNDIFATTYSDANGAGAPPFTRTDYYLVTVTYDDSASTGALQFSATGLAIVTQSATTPNAKTGKYNESGSISLTDGTGQGFYLGVPFVLTGFTVTANGSLAGVP
jgi:hypothetical protein